MNNKYHLDISITPRERELLHKALAYRCAALDEMKAKIESLCSSVEMEVFDKFDGTSTKINACQITMKNAIQDIYNENVAIICKLNTAKIIEEKEAAG